MSQMPPAQPMNYSRPPQPRSVGLSVASMVLGILSIVLCCIWFLSIPMAILAIVLGLVARGQVAQGRAGGGGMAITGIICGVISLLLLISMFALGHFGGPAVQRWLNKVQMKAQQRLEEEQRKQQERQGTTQESLLGQALMANNLMIVLD